MGKKGLLSKKRTKKGPVIELLRTFSRYFHNIAKRSSKARVYDITHFATKKDFCVRKNFCVKKKDQKRTISKGPFQASNENGVKRTITKELLCKKGLLCKKRTKKDYFSSLVLKRTKSLIKDLYASTGCDFSK